MCEYSATEGVPTDWHLVHLGSRAVGGAALVIAEATAVEPIGRISPGCTGIYTDEQVEVWSRIVRFIHEQGSVAGIQIAHAGRKASANIPWAGPGVVAQSKGGWQTVGPSDIPFNENDPKPHALTVQEISQTVQKFKEAAKRAHQAGFKVLELHAAHGYLLNQFLSPLINQRTDQYGGSFENRIRFLREVVAEIKTVWPNELPFFVRISATDWTEKNEQSWGLDESVELSKVLRADGVDLIDVSTGGVVAHAHIPVAPGFQVSFAREIKKRAEIATSAVGLITEPKQAEEIVASNSADMVMLARELLRDPYWPRRAAKELGVPFSENIPVPKQYLRSW